MMKKIFSIEAPAEQGNLHIIRNFYSQSIRSGCPAISDADTAYMELAVNEFCENIIRHGYKGSQGTINIRLIVYENKINTVITDSAKPYNILEYEPIDKEKLVEKGIKGRLGIRMIKTICDRIKYTRLNNKNKTVLTKNIRAQQES